MISLNKLLNIRQNTPKYMLPDFDYSDVLLEIVVGGAEPLKGINLLFEQQGSYIAH